MTGEEGAGIRVVFAPDFREGNPYQELLARALENSGVNVSFLQGYRRGLPLMRSLRRRPFDILHLHWPEAYYAPRNDSLNWLRRVRFPFDLKSALRSRPLVVTAHNFAPHRFSRSPSSVLGLLRSMYTKADAVIAHSARAGERLSAQFGFGADRLHIIPHGDLAESLSVPISIEDARARLGIGQQKICLMFGMIEAYKGIEEVLEWWRNVRPEVELWVVGRSRDSSYANSLEQLCRDMPQIRFVKERPDDQTLAAYIRAADAVLFNYVECFTSGGACLARSLDTPILLPQRLTTIDLEEPNPRVFRFESFALDFANKLSMALAADRTTVCNEEWRRNTAWERVAERTAQVYRSVAAE